jgi:hypothetical protein
MDDPVYIDDECCPTFVPFRVRWGQFLSSILGAILSMGFGGGWTRTSGDRSRGIYSPLQLPLCDTPTKIGRRELSLFMRLLAKGIEPSTIRLQVGRSTN